MAVRRKWRVKDSPFRVGHRVRYVGDQVKANRGKKGKIVDERDEFGFWIEYDDGTRGSAIPGALEFVQLGTYTAPSGSTTTVIPAQQRHPAHTPCAHSEPR